MCWGIDAGTKWAIAEKGWVGLVKTLKIGSLSQNFPQRGLFKLMFTFFFQQLQNLDAF